MTGKLSPTSHYRPNGENCIHEDENFLPILTQISDIMYVEDVFHNTSPCTSRHR